jgi:hypothetical protein
VEYAIICFAPLPIEPGLLCMCAVQMISLGAKWYEERYHVMADFDVDWLGVQPDNTASLIAFDQEKVGAKLAEF